MIFDSARARVTHSRKSSRCRLGGRQGGGEAGGVMVVVSNLRKGWIIKSANYARFALGFVRFDETRP